MTESPAPDANTLNAQLEDRLTQLEIKASYSEDLLDHLNQTVIEQQRHIDALMREVVHLRQQAPAAGDGQPFRSLRDELPPHY